MRSHLRSVWMNLTRRGLPGLPPAQTRFPVSQHAARKRAALKAARRRRGDARFDVKLVEKQLVSRFTAALSFLLFVSVRDALLRRRRNRPRPCTIPHNPADGARTRRTITRPPRAHSATQLLWFRRQVSPQCLHGDAATSSHHFGGF